MPLAVAGGGSEARVGLQHWFARPRPEVPAAAALYAALVEQARIPAFYARLGAPDTLEGRFEVYALHLSLLVLRLKREGEAGDAAAQALFDRFVRGLEDGLREAGVGDTSVPKRMKTLGQALYGRLHGYAEALAALPDEAPLQALVGRTLVADGGGVPAAWTAYVVAAHSGLDRQDGERLRSGEVEWPEVP
jgi:cytochrome b pre-mRNA-processing protein 3